MRVQSIIAIAGALISVQSVCGGDIAAVPQGALTVLLYDYAALPDRMIETLSQQTSEIVSRAGIRLDWAQCRGRQASVLSEPCAGKLEPGQVILRIVPHCLDEESQLGDVLGFAINRSSYISLCADQVRKVEKDKKLYPGSLLPYAAAHEIGHLLLGPGHSREGIMRAVWRRTELSAIEENKLDFSATEGEALRRAVLWLP